MRIGRADVTRKVALIAEIGNNHEGSLELAREMIEAAWDAGADAVKLQTMIPELFVSPRFPERLAQMQRFTLPVDETVGLIAEYRERGITVFSTPLDLVSASRLLDGTSLVKISSGDLTFSQLLCLVGKAGVDVILSTGMATMAEVHEAVTALSREWHTPPVTPSLGILHCVSAYPANSADANLGAIGALKQEFPYAYVGYSDHVIGIDVAARSVAAGATIVEKHFTIDKNFSDFRDHSLSADAADLRLLRSLVDEIREEVGSGIKEPSGAESVGPDAFRRSITLRRFVSAGEEISEADLICQRPGTGLPPSAWTAVLGRVAAHDLDPGHIIAMDDFM
jgi:N,N'-diacetyllegionaminate synthase